MKRQTEHAKAAQMIRQHLKANGIPCRVRSKSYSGGSSITVNVENLLPAAVKEIELFCSRFEMGHFDGMQDLYEYSNTRDDIPQVKFVFVNVTYSDELRQAAWDYGRSIFADLEDAPADYDDNRFYGNEYASTWIHRILNGSDGHFWADRKPHVRLAD